MGETEWQSVMDGAKILIVDDDRVTLQVFSAMLEDAGYRHMWTTHEPEKAIELFRQIAPDLVLLDLHMGELCGMELMKRLKAEMAPQDYLPILMVTGDLSNEAKLKGLLEGAHDYLTKPVDRVEMMLLVRARLETRFRFLEMQRMIDTLRGLGARGASSPGETSTLQPGPARSSDSSVRAPTTTSPADWKARPELLARLDAIAELIDREQYTEARERLRGTRWLADLDPVAAPLGVLRSAQQWIDTGHDALHSAHMDPGLARNALLQARRIVGG